MNNSNTSTFNLLSLLPLMKRVLIYLPSRNIQSTVQTITMWYLSRRALHENMFALPVHEQVQGLDNLSMDIAVCLYSEQTKNMRQTLQQQPTQGALLWKGLNNNRPHTHTRTHTRTRTRTRTRTHTHTHTHADRSDSSPAWLGMLLSFLMLQNINHRAESVPLRWPKLIYKH